MRKLPKINYANLPKLDDRTLSLALGIAEVGLTEWKMTKAERADVEHMVSELRKERDRRNKNSAQEK